MSDAIPKGGEFLEGKLWFSRRGSKITLGLTDLALASIGEIESIELPDEGADYDKGEVVVMVEGTQGSLEVITPAAGFIEDVNMSAQAEPASVTEDPLEEGWLVRLEVQDLADLRDLGVETESDYSSEEEEDEEDDEEDEEDDEEEDEDEGDLESDDEEEDDDDDEESDDEEEEEKDEEEKH